MENKQKTLIEHLLEETRKGKDIEFIFNNLEENYLEFGKGEKLGIKLVDKKDKKG